jgi:heme-binding NEAT domain protein
MSFTTYSTAVAGTVLAAAFWNQQVRDNGNILKTSIADDGRVNGEVVRFYDNITTIAAAASITIDVSGSNAFVINLSATAITGITISGWTASKAQPIIVKVKQDGTGSRSISGWPAAMKGDNGTTTPTITTTASHWTTLTLYSDDGGTTIQWNYFQANGG